MAEQVFLHVGTPKSGTSYIQAVLTGNKQRLERNEQLLFPGRTWDVQVRAVRDILGLGPAGRPAVAGAWQQLVDQVASWAGDAVISMEWLCSASPDRARRIVDSLGRSEVHVILTARDLARTIPAAWQEFIQNRQTWPWDEFLRSVTAEDRMSTPAGRAFWRQQDLSRILTNWSEAVPADHVHVIPLPLSGGGPDDLVTRFGRVVGVDFARYDTSGGSGNQSLGLASTLLLQRVNVASRQRRMGASAYDRQIKHSLAKRGLSERKAAEALLTVPPEFQALVEDRGHAQAEAVRAHGVHVVGSLDELHPRVAATMASPEDVTCEEMLDAAADGLVLLARNNADALAKANTEVSELRNQVAELLEHGGRDQEATVRGRVRRSLIRASERWQPLGVARRLYVRARRRRR